MTHFINLFLMSDFRYWSGTKHLPKEVAEAIKGKTLRFEFDSYPVYINHRCRECCADLEIGNNPSLRELAARMLGALRKVYDEYLPKDGTAGVEVFHNFDDLSLEGIEIDTEALKVRMCIGS